MTAAGIVYWPATPRMKSIRPAIAERLDTPDVGKRSEQWLLCPQNLAHSPSPKKQTTTCRTVDSYSVEISGLKRRHQSAQMKSLECMNILNL